MGCCGVSMSKNNNGEDDCVHCRGFATPERKENAYNNGYKWGLEFGEIDYDGSWGYDAGLMASYISGCKKGVREWREKQ